uniref:Uncharacterized protein n=1 Tax=Aegilops tauschii TaxID=37682 RepID=M8C9I2_AEGTA
MSWDNMIKVRTSRGLTMWNHNLLLYMRYLKDQRFFGRWSISYLPSWSHFTERTELIKGYDFNYTSVTRGPPIFDKAL